MKNQKTKTAAIEEIATEVNGIEQAETIDEGPGYDEIPAAKRTVLDDMALRESLNEFKKTSTIESWEISSCVNDNLDRLSKSLAPIEKHEKWIAAGLKDFRKEEQELGVKHATVKGKLLTHPDANGNPSYSIQDWPAYNAELKLLKSKYKKQIDLANDRMQQHITKCEQKESSCELVYLNREVAKAEAPKISPALMELIYPLLEPLKK